jgi:ribonuclease HII
VRAAPPDGARDRTLAARFGLIAGVDEVGRGALAGPVTVAAVILDLQHPLIGLDDSKRLSPRVRERLAAEILEHALCWAVAHRSPAEIDRLNILEATRAAMVEAVNSLARVPGLVVTDALPLPELKVAYRAEVHADARYQCVAAASILAKVTRDRMMVQLARTCPDYGWESNKGYPSPHHLAALRRLGPCGQHRRTFRPLRVLA